MVRNFLPSPWPVLDDAPSSLSLPHPQAAALAGRPVFLHTGWRSAGTWLWSRFRSLPEVMGYYEPLHTLLADRPRVLMGACPEAWSSGHPSLEAPYFQEFLPLMQRHWFRLHRWGRREGVRHYSPAFEIDRFNAVPPEAEALDRYVRHLLQHAQRHRRTPVLKFCRSMGRMGWMMQRYPNAVHVAVLRQPLAQYASMRTQLLRDDNPGFFEMTFKVLCANRGVPRVARVLSALGCSLPARLDGAQQVRGMDACAHYRAFLALWVLQGLAIPPRVSAVIDSDALGLDAGYNRQVCDLLTHLTGLSPDLSDARAHPLVVTPDNCDATLGLRWGELTGLHERARGLVRQETVGHDAHLLPWLDTKLSLASAHG